MTTAGGGSVTLPPTIDAGPPEAPPREMLATWLSRVVAVVLDNAILAAVTFVAVGAVTPPSLVPGLNTDTFPQESSTAWDAPGRAWVVGTFAVLLLMQAYLGATPGKLVLGIAVVRGTDARPAGAVTTALRAVAHVLDAALLMIGYLRPLWHPQNRTFADSLVGTVVLQTRHPWPYRPPWSTPAPAPATWVGPARQGRRQATVAAVVVCAVALVVAWWPSSTTFVSTRSSCVIDPVQGAGSSPGGITLVGAEVRTGDDLRRVRKLGVERTTPVDPGPRPVRVRWDWQGDAWDGDTRLRFVFTTPEGARGPAGEVIVRNGALVADGPLWAEHPDTVVLPGDWSSGIGPGWGWRVSGTGPSGDLGACTGVVG
jgi:Mce-associated membrane protein